jgi:hypothetical protein
MSVPSPDHPARDYEQRVAACAVAHRRAKRLHDLLAWMRLGALLAIVGTSYERCGSGGGGSTAAVWLSWALFVALWVAIGAATRKLGQVAEAERYYRLGLARLAGSEEGHPFDGRRFEPALHPYSIDLDLFGPGSLFSRLCTARTSSGQAARASWLLHPAGREQVEARQAAVAELRQRLPLREELWRGAGPMSRDVRVEALEAWLRTPVTPPRRASRVIAAFFSLAAASAILAFALGQPLPFIGLVIVEFLFARRHAALVADIAHGVQERADDLKAVALLASIVERERFTSPRLVELAGTLTTGGRSASKRIARLVTLVEWFESRRNPFFGITSAPFLVITQLAFAIARWRHEHGQQAAGWLEALGEFEALVSLATYAFEHPDQVQAEIVPDGEGPLFEAENVAHPLLPAATRVGNDVRLDRQTRLWLVTGSNMSGKSTLLRTVGASTVLALAGAPVPARRLRLSHLEVGASLRTVDSLQAGVSRFFAEIKRLRTILELAEKSPLTLFLLDEILHGTNSQDRFAGAEALVRRLVERGAIGLVTTHDLTLARIVDELAVTGAARPAINVHFEDVIAEGQLSFDYLLRPGVVTRGNALALMRLVGLPVG